LVLASDYGGRRLETMDAIRAIVLLGTPHRGSRLASILEVIPSKSIAELGALLAFDSPFLLQLNDNFKKLWTSTDVPQIISFFELRSSALFFRPVSQVSATLPGYRTRGLDVSHSRLVKYASEEDENHLAIVNFINESIKDD
jgi:hypothetical protein